MKDSVPVSQPVTPRPPSQADSAPGKGGLAGLGCGLAFGIVLGALWVVLDGFSPAILIVAAAVFGTLAYRYGDRFWNWLAEHWWLPWF